MSVAFAILLVTPSWPHEVWTFLCLSSVFLILATESYRDIILVWGELGKSLK